MPRKKTSTNHSNTQDVPAKPQIEPIEETVEEKIISLKTPKKKVFWSRFKRKTLKHVYFVRFLIISVVVVTIVFLANFLGATAKKSQLGFYFSLVRGFVSMPHEATSAINNRVNILIMGKGGKGHEAPDLTDTMIFTSIKNEPSGKWFGIGGNSKISMISLPRDIWIYDLRAKLNSIYYWGNQKGSNGGGLVLSKSVVEEVVGLPVQYAVVVDFSGFQKIIDVLGGIEVDVQNSFIDNDFPIAGREADLCDGDPEFRCRYETVKFEKGLQHMDGKTALKFARSRHAESDEGTDLARAARQERVVQAIKNRLLTKEVYLHPNKIFAIKDAVLSSIETDISPQTAAVLARWFLQGKNNINSVVLSQDLLENPPKLAKYDNLYVFIPKEVDDKDPSGRSWSGVQKWVMCQLDNNCN